MKKADILYRVLNLVNPKLDNILNNLKDEEIDYFIYHFCEDIEQSLKKWQFKNSTWKLKYK